MLKRIGHVRQTEKKQIAPEHRVVQYPLVSQQQKLCETRQPEN
jgi:hypothetical protein